MTIKKLLIAAAISAASATSVLAQDFPSKSLEFIVPFPPGGASNLIGRAIAEAMSADLGQDITVMNRAGAAGTVGGAELARATPDGYTIGILTSTPLMMKPQTTDLPYDLSSFDLICRGFDNPLILTVKKGSELNSFEDMLAKAKSSPTALKYYTEGPGSLQDIAMGELQAAGDFKAVGVPMTGFQNAVQNLLSGVIDVAPLTAGTVLGSPDLLQPIGIMARERVSNPDVQTMTEALGKEIVYSLGGAIVAPKGLDKVVYDRLVQACATAQKSDSFTATLNKFDMPPVSDTGAAFAEAYTAEYNAVGDYIKANGVGQ